MARPKHASDEEVLQAAHRIYTERGHQGFTLSELARDVGLSRAAIIQRFDSADALRMKLARERIGRFATILDALPVAHGGDGLVSLAAFIGSLVGERRQLSSFMQNLQADLGAGELLELEKSRGKMLDNAIGLRMPALNIDPHSAVLAFRAQLSGSLWQWQVEERDISARDFLVERTREWLRLAGIPFGETVEYYPAPGR